MRVSPCLLLVVCPFLTVAPGVTQIYDMHVDYTLQLRACVTPARVTDNFSPTSFTPPAKIKGIRPGIIAMMTSVLVAMLLPSVADGYAPPSVSAWVAPPIRSSTSSRRTSTSIYPRRCLNRCRSPLSSTTAGSSASGGSSGGFSAEPVAKPPLKVTAGLVDCTQGFEVI